MRTTEAVFHKAVALATRTVEDRRELLTFVHPLAGRQVPAGSVEIDEKPVHAAVRELFEEAGVLPVQQVHSLGTDRESFAETAILTRTTILYETPTSSVGRRAGEVKRGHTVSILEANDAWSHVAQRVYDFNVVPIVVVEEISGWLPSDILVTELDRHFFHVVVGPCGPSCWENNADGHTFRFQWIPLVPPPRLIVGQQQWIDRYHSAIANDSCSPHPRI